MVQLKKSAESRFKERCERSELATADKLIMGLLEMSAVGEFMTHREIRQWLVYAPEKFPVMVKVLAELGKCDRHKNSSPLEVIFEELLSASRVVVRGRKIQMVGATADETDIPDYFFFGVVKVDDDDLDPRRFEVVADGGRWLSIAR